MRSLRVAAKRKTRSSASRTASCLRNRLSKRGSLRRSHHTATTDTIATAPSDKRDRQRGVRRPVAEQERERADHHHDRDADAVENIFEDDRREGGGRRDVAADQQRFGAFARERPERQHVADRIAGDVRLERLAEREALGIFHAQRPRLGANGHADGREREDDEEAEADLAELPEDFARAGGLQRVDEQQHAGDGGDDGDRVDSGP